MSPLLLILPLCPIIYEDFRFRAIHWIWVLLLTLLAIGSTPWRLDWVVFNVSFTIIQLLFLSLYFSVKEKRWVNIINQYLGLGDVVFFIPLWFVFAPLNYVGFFILSLIGSLIGVLFFQLFIKKLKSVPLAGCMSIALILLIGMQWLGYWNPQDDQPILQFLNSLYHG